MTDLDSQIAKAHAAAESAEIVFLSMDESWTNRHLQDLCATPAADQLQTVAGRVQGGAGLDRERVLNVADGRGGRG